MASSWPIRRSNPWVPYPLSFRRLQQLFAEVGEYQVQKVQERAPRRGFEAMYGALIQPSGQEIAKS